MRTGDQDVGPRPVEGSGVLIIHAPINRYAGAITSASKRGGLLHFMYRARPKFLSAESGIHTHDQEHVDFVEEIGQHRHRRRG